MRKRSRKSETDNKNINNHYISDCSQINEDKCCNYNIDEVNKRTKEERTNKRTKNCEKDEDEKNRYIGWKVPSSSTHKTEGDNCCIVELDRIDALSVTPEWFYEKYISRRKPCILIHPETNFATGEKLISDNFQRMKELAGHVEVQVETRTSQDQSYGQGQKVNMKFANFLQKLSSAEEHDLFYLTTQPPMLPSSSHLNQDETKAQSHHDCIPKPYLYIMPALIMNLFFNSSNHINQKDQSIPLQPKIMGNLIPQSIQLWMGRTSHRTSSGLHHDFHDNYYHVFQGEKEFELYSPADALHMNTNGQITKVHSNGLIQYQSTTYSDGSPIDYDDNEDDEDNIYNDNEKDEDNDDEAARLMQELENAEESFNNCPTDPDAKQRYEKAEEDLNQYMESMLELNNKEKSNVENYDSNNDEEEWENNNNDSNIDDDNDDNDDENVDFWESAEKLRQKQHSLTLPANKKSCTIATANLTIKKDNNAIEMSNDCKNANDLKIDNADGTEEPVHFCNESSMRCHKISKLCVKVHEGEVLYLPASWFHKVYSTGGNHMALNYWFHPPSSDGGTFQEPYITNYWNRDWKEKE